MGERPFAANKNKSKRNTHPTSPVQTSLASYLQSCYLHFHRESGVAPHWKAMDASPLLSQGTTVSTQQLRGVLTCTDSPISQRPPCQQDIATIYKWLLLWHSYLL